MKLEADAEKGAEGVSTEGKPAIGPMAVAVPAQGKEKHALPVEGDITEHAVHHFLNFTDSIELCLVIDTLVKFAFNPAGQAEH